MNELYMNKKFFNRAKEQPSLFAEFKNKVNGGDSPLSLLSIDVKHDFCIVFTVNDGYYTNSFTVYFNCTGPCDSATANLTAMSAAMCNAIKGSEYDAVNFSTDDWLMEESLRNAFANAYWKMEGADTVVPGSGSIFGIEKPEMWHVEAWAEYNYMNYDSYCTADGMCVEVDTAYGLKSLWYYNSDSSFDSYEELDAFKKKEEM